MPNNFQVVGLFTPGYAMDVEKFNAEAEAGEHNFCQLVMPMPEELENIHTGITSIQNKKVSIWREEGDKKFEVDSAELKAKYGADNWYDWQKDNWGTKWGCYSVKAFKLEDDGDSILITFCCAWGPPKKTVMIMITDYLKEKYEFENHLWIGADPYDNTCAVVES